MVFTHFDSVGTTFVFSVDEVFSYKVVDRRGIIPPPLLGPTVRLPLAGSYLDVVVRGLAGLDAAENEIDLIRKSCVNEFI